jgi:CDP-diacylglycerol--glycerol-3-phosphate 3-phosphatidyltransferase
MPSTYDLKQKFSGLLRPVANTLVRMGVSANAVTNFATLLSIGFGALIYFLPTTGLLFLLFSLLLLLRMALNNIDGVIAREHDQKTALGSYLNELGDVVSDVALYLPFARVTGFNLEAVLLFVLTGVVAEFTGVLAHAQGKERSYRGPSTKSDRALIMALLSLAIYFGLTQTAVINGVLLVMSALSLLTISNRIKYGTAVDHA